MDRRWSVVRPVLSCCLLSVEVLTAASRWSIWFPPPPDLPVTPRTVPQLRSFLRDQLGLDATRCGEKDVNPNILFFSRGPLERDRLMALGRFPERIADWAGVVMVDQVNPQGENLIVLNGWEGCGFQYGSFLFFGDPALLTEIETVLRGPPE
jgi:hypothetical protein